ncbi:MAG: alpha/beta hydrolase [Xanthomonadales bacterium]|nr:alpha/beta hydrolase [Xanthomonadales bacterium]
MSTPTRRILRAALATCGLAASPALFALAFAPCELLPPGGVAGPKAQCATLAVPEDRARPEGRQIELAIARIEARRRPAHPDPVLFLAGGPGQSALESYGQVAPAFRELLADRAVVLVDQRGTGRSHPLRCELPDASDPAAPMPDAEALAALARDCLASLDAEVAHYTTRDYLADLETVREALGVRQWNLVGGSYGTRVALSYMQAHPERVRSAVLDGVVPQDVALGQDHGAFLDAALAAQFGRCRADPACAAAFGDPAATLAELRRRYRETPTTVIIPDPRSHRPIEVALNHETLAGTVRMFAYSPEYTALLPLLLHQAREGDPQPLLAQARILFADLEDMIAHGMQLSVGCSEDAPWLNPLPGDDSLIGADLVGFMRAQCSAWPVPRAPGAFKQPVDSELPVLLLSGEYDPVTPPAYAERALATLGNARHLVAPGQGHIVMARGCMPTLVARFVRAGEVGAIGDAGCLDTLAPWPFYLDFNGSAP